MTLRAFRAGDNRRSLPMTWTAPKLDEIACGMEINMYFPADDQDELF